jgi:DNA modification methylase
MILPYDANPGRMEFSEGTGKNRPILNDSLGEEFGALLYDSDYQRQYEPILYGWKEGTDHYWCGARDQGDVWFFDKPVKNDLHPTMKPVALVERAIRNSSKSRDIVLDPFGGSGTTLIAAEHAGRRARLIERDPKYIDVIVKRWQNQTGQIARLEPSGEAFASNTRAVA